MIEINLTNDIFDRIHRFETEQFDIMGQLISNYNVNIISKDYKDERSIEYSNGGADRPAFRDGYECSLKYSVRKGDFELSTKWPIVRIDGDKVMLFEISEDDIRDDLEDMTDEIELNEENHLTALPTHTSKAWSYKSYKTYDSKEKKLFWFFVAESLLLPIILIIIACFIPEIVVYLLIAVFILLCIAVFVAKLSGII